MNNYNIAQSNSRAIEFERLKHERFEREKNEKKLGFFHENLRMRQKMTNLALNFRKKEQDKFLNSLLKNLSSSQNIENQKMIIKIINTNTYKSSDFDEDCAKVLDLPIIEKERRIGVSKSYNKLTLEKLESPKTKRNYNINKVQTEGTPRKSLICRFKLPKLSNNKIYITDDTSINTHYRKKFKSNHKTLTEKKTLHFKS